MLIDEVLDSLKEKYGLNKSTLEHIVDSQFKLVHESMEDKCIKSIKLMNLGKISPSTYLINNHEELSKKS